MARKELTREERNIKILKKYTSEHGGPDLITKDDKYKCLACVTEVPLEEVKCPGCGRKIDWAKYIVVGK